MSLIARIVFCLTACCGQVSALSVAKIFGDAMVLQRERPIPIWGRGTPSAEVTVEFKGKKHSTRVDNEGRWRLEMPPLAASNRGLELAVRSEENTLVLRDVLIGEVWFAGGQSNMAHSMRSSAGKLPEFASLIAEADYRRIRIRKVNESNAATPRPDLSGGSWVLATPDSARHFSAVAYLFARRLHKELDVPVGIIEAAWGGTPIEPQIPTAAFTGHPTLERIRKLGAKKDLAALHAMPGGTFARSEVWLAGQIFNGRIAPVAPYAIRGAIWYQGESNCGNAEDPRDYAVKMRALIKGWRAAWQRPDLPFYFVQLPQWKSPAWPYLREEQRQAMDVPGSGMAVTIDLNFHNDIHPPNKLDVAERLARWPLAQVHGKKVAFRSAMYREHKMEGDVITVGFAHAEGGLVAGKTNTGEFIATPETPINGFEICSKDGVWRAAKAVVAGSSVKVSAPEGSAPIAVRYACQPVASAEQPWNLYNRAGLPAAPFSSDWARMPYKTEANGH